VEPSTTRYLIRFSDGGTGLRQRDEPLAVGDEIEDCGDTYMITRVEITPDGRGPVLAWAELRPR
jgi:hypothetical protein